MKMDLMLKLQLQSAMLIELPQSSERTVCVVVTDYSATLRVIDPKMPSGYRDVTMPIAMWNGIRAAAHRISEIEADGSTVERLNLS